MTFENTVYSDWTPNLQSEVGSNDSKLVNFCLFNMNSIALIRTNTFSYKMLFFSIFFCWKNVLKLNKLREHAILMVRQRIGGVHLKQCGSKEQSTNWHFWPFVSFHCTMYLLWHRIARYKVIVGVLRSSENGESGKQEQFHLHKQFKVA